MNFYSKSGSRNNYRKTQFLCPECMSKLTTNSDYSKVCSGDKLKYWAKEFKKYKKLNDDDKQQYLESVSMKGKFLDLYDRWCKVGSISCDYSNRIYSLVSDNVTTIPDPLQIKYLEKQLKTVIDVSKLDEDSSFKLPDGQVVKVEWVKLPLDN